MFAEVNIHLMVSHICQRELDLVNRYVSDILSSILHRAVIDLLLQFL